MSRLLIVYHSKNGHTAAMARAVSSGATNEELETEVRVRTARDATVDDVLWCSALLIGTPENFGYMSSGMKDFFDRTYYPLQGRVEGLPYALFVSAGNDGEGAVRAIHRIAKGYPLKEVQEPLISRGDITNEMLERCEELGMFMAAGAEANLF